MIKLLLESVMLKLRVLSHLYKIRLANKTCRIYSGAAISNSSLGEYAVLFKNVFIYKSKIGAHTYIQEDSKVYNSDIGPFCSIASSVVIGLVGHPTHLISTHPAFYDNTQPLPYFMVEELKYQAPVEKTIVGADVWIGHGAFLKSGITVGTGSIIAAGAVVTGDVAPYSIVGGIPAKEIKKRFDEKLCNDLLESRWWEQPKEKLKNFSAYFNDPEKFLVELKKAGK